VGRRMFASWVVWSNCSQSGVHRSETVEPIVWIRFVIGFDQNIELLLGENKEPVA
jgi:hypothetical protein